MRSRPLSPRRTALGLVLAAATALHVGPAVGAPDDSEPLMQLLADKGLLPFPDAPPPLRPPATPQHPRPKPRDWSAASTIAPPTWSSRR